MAWQVACVVYVWPLIAEKRRLVEVCLQQPCDWTFVSRLRTESDVIIADRVHTFASKETNEFTIVRRHT